MTKHLCVTLDVETTTYQKGNPYSRCNKLVSIGIKVAGKEAKRYRVLGMPEEWKQHVKEDIQNTVRESRFLVAFNAKFDLAWLRRFGVDVSEAVVWDCQLWEFLDSAQQWRYPDLDTALKRHGLPTKLDVIKEHYWKKGIDTPDIPKRVLDLYLKRDLETEELLFLRQYDQRRPWLKLFRLQCADLLVLQEMEWNGTLYNESMALEKAEHCKLQVDSIAEELRGMRESAWEWDFNSSDDTSVFLFGGTLTKEDSVCVGTYKSGLKAGQPKYKKVEYQFHFDPLIPNKDAKKAKKDGFYLASEPALMAIAKTKKVKAVVDKLLEYRGLNKLMGTYYLGLPKIREAMDWPYGMLHSNYNQCVAVTGRLSSDKPNRQNMPSEVYDLLLGRMQ